MAEEKTLKRARRDAQEGKAASTQAGEFVREEIEHIREGKHGARSTKQAIAIGLSKARRAGVPLPPPEKEKTSEKTRKSAERAYEKGQAHDPISPRRSEAREMALKQESREAATPYGTFAPGPGFRCSENAGRALRCGTKSGPHQGTSWTIRSGQKGGKNTDP